MTDINLPLRTFVDIDIFDDRYRWIGTADNREAHRRGLWHRVFTCLVVHPARKSVTLQAKQPGRYGFERPDFLDVSVGGHYHAGEQVCDGVRELREELGLDVQQSALVPIGVRQTAATLAPDYIANEFQHVFLLPTDAQLATSAVDNEEVRGLVEVPLDATMDLLLGRVDQTYAVAWSAAMTPALVDGRFLITRAVFAPSYLETDQLFPRLFVAAHRYVRGDDPRLIFW
jgi:8-oxo-dGTP pyrophosphatase MutT (NUDIX family)